MKTDLSHLPDHKRQELQLALSIIQNEIDLEMLILFGSYARGDWVEDIDEHTLLPKYQSDYDLLVVTETPRQAQRVEQNNKLFQRLFKIIHRTPVSLIAEDIKFFNKRLRKSQYFYIDILHEGIMLFDSGKFALAEPIEISIKERKRLAEKDFAYWFNKAISFWDYYELAIYKENNNYAAFLLHQLTESLYNTTLLVFTRYKPSIHDLEKLQQRVSSVEPEFARVFPQNTEEEKNRFKLLRKAYVDARYNRSYTINQAQLTWLTERINDLQHLTQTLCLQKIESYQ